MQKIIFIGNLTSEPELRTTPNGINVCTFTVAVNRRYSSSKEERQTDFFRVAAWRQLGENCARYLTKGKKVAVTGEVSARAYEGKDGSIRASLEVTADEVEFLSPKGEQSDGGNRPAAYYERPAEAPAEDERGGTWAEITDGDLPF